MHKPPGLFAAIAREAAGRLHFNEQNLANLAWACAVADAHDADLVAALRRRLERGGIDFTDEGLTQLHQAQLWCERERGLPDAAQPLPPALRERCRAAMFDKATADAARQRVSDFQRQVGASLRRLGEVVEEEHITADGHSLDYALVDERIAIEVDGPSHFVAHGDGAGRRELGNTELKRRQLGALGWRLVAVPFFEWEEFNDFSSAQSVG